MRRIALLLTLLVGSLAAASIAQASLTFGISDQQALTFVNPKYNALKLKVARYIAPYDVMTNRDQLQRMDTWLKAARADHQRILLSFEHSRTAGKESTMPSIAEYTAQMKAVKAVYNSYVKDISPWNEVNVCQKNGRVEGQPAKLCSGRTGPKLAAQITAAGRKVWTGKSIVVLDFLDGKSPAAAIKYVAAFKRAAKPSSGAIWGLHNYSDTNRYSDKQQRTRQILKTIGRGQIWLTETGGQVTLGKRSVKQGAPLAAKALGCMFYISREYKQITRVYIYSFYGTPENTGLLFDSGLVASDGNTERPGYAIVKKRKSIKCNK